MTKANRTYRRAFIARLKNTQLGRLEILVLEPEEDKCDLSECQKWYSWWKNYGVDMYELDVYQ